MSDVEDVTMGDSEQPFKREIPAVPIPDWSVENYKTMAPTRNMEQVVNTCTGGEVAHNLIQNPATANNTPSMSVISGFTATETPHKANSSRTGLVDPGSTSSSLSRFIGDVPSTPTHSLSTPVYNYTNPHSTMVAATPAPASGVNQAINSIKLQNCVSTVNVGCELRLLDIYCKTRYSEYNPQRFQGVVMKIMDPRATALIFKSGKIVCTGARNEYDSYIAARKFARIIERLGFPAKFLEFKIQNFCATADLKFPIRLEALQQAHGQFASYEPELFPGLVYRMVRPRVVLLIFVNGKIVFTGGKNRNEITEALEIIYPILRGYRIS